ncbi:MAG TPA: ATP-binding cassette domain-containing protein [Caulobacteraceae bacterium]|nr:ATP-binding cassette domain-containing protein [Caulobacteraceae bacterium]
MAAPLIALDNIGKSFDGGRSFALRGVSLDIAQGEFIALVGGSGSGKTTTLKTINRLIDPDEGQVRLDGRPVEDRPGPELRRGIGYVFQGIGLFPHLTVGENIAVTPRLLGWRDADIAARVAELLDLVALPREVAGRRPSALSGGQQQRVGVARALAARPRVMLMDEPFGALDPLTRQELGDAYRDLHRRLGLTTVMVTHDVSEAVLLADRIAVMKSGRLLAVDTPRALMAGHPDPDVAALMSTPRRQADRVAALMAGPA